MRLWRTLVCAFLGFTSADHPLVHDFDGYQNGLYGNTPSQKYRSSNLTSPIFNYNTWRKELIAGDESSHLLLTLGYGGSGPYIFRDDDLSLVYADPSFDYAMNARVQNVKGTDYLTFWHGAKNHGDSQGYCVFYDDLYQLKYNVTLSGPFTVDADMHECEVTPTGSVLLTAYQDKRYDLTSLGGKIDDMLADGCFQDVDIQNNNVLSSWCATDHFDPGMAYWNFTGVSRERQLLVATSSYTTSSGFDAYHINSVQKTKEGNYLVSLRNLKLITYIDGKTGEPIWNLGGKVNDFTDVTAPSVLAANTESEGALSFGWQHHVRFLDDAQTHITLFDNHNLTTEVDCGGPTCSRGRHLQIDTTDPNRLTVQLVRDYRSPQGLTSVIFGSMQPLQSSSSTDTTGLGPVLVGWGVNAEFDEYTSNGDLVRDVQYSRLDPEHSFAGSGSVASYRVFKQSWHGYPTWPPSIVIVNDSMIYVSWNGATEVRRWSLYCSESAALLGAQQGSWTDEPITLVGLDPLKTMKRQGFETEIPLNREVMFELPMPAYCKVAALDGEGHIIGTTKTAKVRAHASPAGNSGCLFQETFSFTCLIQLLV